MRLKQTPLGPTRVVARLWEQVSDLYMTMAHSATSNLVMTYYIDSGAYDHYSRTRSSFKVTLRRGYKASNTSGGRGSTI